MLGGFVVYWIYGHDFLTAIYEGRSLAFLNEVNSGTFRHGLAVVKYCTIEDASHGVGTDLSLFQRQDLLARVLEEAAAGLRTETDKPSRPDRSSSTVSGPVSFFLM